LFIVNNRDYCVSNSEYHNIITRWRNYLPLPQISLAMYQKGVCYSGIKIFNGIPKAIKDISSKPKKFKIALKQCCSIAGPQPGTRPWQQLYRAARCSPAICHFSFLIIFH
jgi:hypothetical protein